ncbi:TlpA disulfide reductase family protein [Bacteroides helcogenes]|uniref:Alkyl hydroperoxide reductase/ Thiol specific antioxidant/ Mal allergen n=1 Tax=Bacteroides helcogenes (strain ATCC 35417 / DSM 20613 / JCM 6297 / CCUG 15421 / P 36-108) TaxID=693979 RepID=E6SPE3_BACT6|nr:TlpA disulfide reductase family protein [Bacteroides helcogenes]ADV42832.1 alkyl hydroperoxide reductase/ Thiol specific antioxidant/ Mal allergen [Bacteroides helcogenes P 36-108]
MKKLVFLMLSLVMLASSYTSVPDGALKGVLSGTVSGVDSAYIVLKMWDIEVHGALKTIDSIPVVGGKFEYNYYEPNGSQMVKVFLQRNDSTQQVVFFVNPFVKKNYTFHCGDIYLDNSRTTIYLDSLCTKGTMAGEISARIEGSVETDIMYRKVNDEIFVNHYFDKEGVLTNPDFIRENPKSYSLLNSVYESKGQYKSFVTLKSHFNLFDVSLKESPLGKEMQEYLAREEALAKSGIARDFSFYDLDGNNYHFKDFIGDRKLGLIVFWASWCGPCKAELPELKDLYRHYQDRVSFVSMSIDKKFEDWSRAVRADNVDWPSLSGHPESATKVVDVFHTSAVPTFILVDDRGNILFSNVGGRAEIDGVNRFVQLKDIANLMDKYLMR